MTFILLLFLFSGNHQAAVDAFVKTHPCPATKKQGPCPGYVVDHIVGLRCGGEDKSSNLQWQTEAEARAKDRFERQECKKWSEENSKPKPK